MEQKKVDFVVVNDEKDGNLELGNNKGVYTSDSLKQYLNEISQFSPLTKKEQHELLEDYRNKGDKEAWKRLIEGNLQLVVSRAKKYCDQGIDLLDLINVGNEGLMQAIEKFDLDQSVKFSTYACFWIDGHIRNTIVDQGRSIRIPRNKYYSINKFLKLKEEIQVLEGKVSLEYLSRLLGVSVEKILQYEQYSKSLISIYSEMAESSDLDCVDLDCMDFDEQLVDTISDEEQKTPEEICLDNMVREEVREDIFWALERLKNKEKWVIIEKYGFLDGEYKTSKQTALALYEKGIFTSLVSDRWIWQIEVSAMKRLRSDPYLKTYDPNSKNFGVPGRKSLNLVKRK